MSFLPYFVSGVFAIAIILAIVGFVKFFRFLPEFLRANTGNSVALHRFRFQEYVDWLDAHDRKNSNALLLFASGLALALMTFPFLLAL